MKSVLGFLADLLIVLAVMTLAWSIGEFFAWLFELERLDPRW